MDIFNEYIIKRKRSGKDYLKIFGMIFGSVILYYIVMLLLSRLGIYGTVLIFPAPAGVVFLDWYVIRSFRVEFEYSVTNGYMVIDKIIARSRRKRQILGLQKLVAHQIARIYRGGAAQKIAYEEQAYRRHKHQHNARHHSGRRKGQRHGDKRPRRGRAHVAARRHQRPVHLLDG